ncbi:MAG: hypothetical protein VZR06_10305 [Butyrivibrio sp.]|nr:hypothetical protein [Butyrivibrio sp.]
MLALFSVIVPGESIGIHNILFIVATLLFWLFIVLISGDIYDMRSDILASIGTSDEVHVQ